jgi:hypothetical protein
MSIASNLSFLLSASTSTAVVVNGTDDSTSTQSGALVVSGGVGVGGSGYFGGNLYLTGNLYQSGLQIPLNAFSNAKGYTGSTGAAGTPGSPGGYVGSQGSIGYVGSQGISGFQRVSTVFTPGALTAGSTAGITRFYPVNPVTVSKITGNVLTNGSQPVVVNIQVNNVTQAQLTVPTTGFGSTVTNFATSSATDFITVFIANNGATASDLFVSLTYQ